jgi:hypothetical protein
MRYAHDDRAPDQRPTRISAARPAEQQIGHRPGATGDITRLQRLVGNRAVVATMDGQVLQRHPGETQPEEVGQPAAGTETTAEESTGPKVVSIAVTDDAWGAAALSVSGTCFAVTTDFATKPEYTTTAKGSCAAVEFLSGGSDDGDGRTSALGTPADSSAETHFATVSVRVHSSISAVSAR